MDEIEAAAEDEAAWDAEPNPQMVRWQPSRHSVRTGLNEPRAGQSHAGLGRADAAGLIGLAAMGSFAVGALAIGALAIGAVAIGRLGVRDARFRRLQVDELVIGKVRWRR